MKKTNKILSILLVIAMMLTMAPITVFAADNLTDSTTGVTLKDTDNDGYYEIGTAEQLYAFANLVNAGNTAISAELTADIVLNENVIASDGSLNGDPSKFKKWTPIGNKEAKFSGVFDGGKHTISGLFYHGTGEYAGFFGYIEGVYNSETAGFVKNLGIVDSYFLLESTERWFRTGGIVGFASKTSVKNCYVIANFDLTTTYYNPSIYIGGIGGMTNYADVRNCYTVMNVSLDYKASHGIDSIGGILAAATNEKMIDCHTNYNSLGSYNTGTDITGTTYNVSKEKFKSGEITYLLNGSTAVASSIWKQTIGEDDYPSFNGKNVDYDETKGYYNVSHAHSFDYSTSGNTITAICTEENCYLNNADGGYVTISAPTDTCTDGNAVVDNQLADKSTVVNVVYSTSDGTAPTVDGTYTASITLGDATATVEFTLGHDYDYENSVLTRPIRITTTEWDDGYYTYVCNICDDYYQETVKRADYTEFEETYNKILGHLNGSDLTNEAKAEILGAVQDYLSNNPEFNDSGNVRGDLIESEQTIVDNATAFAKQILAVIESNLSNCESGNHDVRSYTSDNNATCTEDGTKRGNCYVCGEEVVVTDESNLAFDHDYDYENGVLTRPTDSAKGYYTYTCKNDSNHTTTEEVESADYTEYDKAAQKIAGYFTNPNLTSASKQLINEELKKFAQNNSEYCDNNGNLRRDLIASEQDIVDNATKAANELIQVVDGILANCEAGNHDVRKYTSDNNATCTEDGTKRGNCVVCGKEVVVTDESNLAFDHDYDYENGVLTRPTETEKGYYTYTCKNDANHTTTEEVESADYSEFDEAFGKVLGYLNGSELTNEAKAEIYTAVQNYIANNPNFDSNGNLRRDLIESEQNIVDEATGVANGILAVIERNLSNCESGNHDVRNYTPNNNATCTEDGTKTGNCYVCGEEVTIDDENAPALGHDMITDEAVEPTCTETGLTEGSHCSRCDDATTAQETVPALGHDMITDEAVAPTCTETGLTEGAHCSRCDEATTAQETIPALGHTPLDAVEENYVAPNCTENGSKDMVVYCDVCDAELERETETLDALGHTEEELPAVAPTCTETGLTAGVKCSVCGETLTAQEEVPALGHTPEDAVEENYVAPNCTENGSKDIVIYCAVCDAEISRETETIEASGHNDEDNDGYCDDCDEQLCNHACHKGGIRGFFWKIIKFFYRLINIQQYCDCGNLHYEKPIFNIKL